jgi:hypothetical protein
VYSNSATVLRKSDNKLISNTKQSEKPISATVLRKSLDDIKFTLSWSHYLLLMRIENEGVAVVGMRGVDREYGRRAE